MISARLGPIPVMFRRPSSAVVLTWPYRRRICAAVAWEAVRYITSRPADTIDGADHRGGSGGSRHHAIDFCRAEAGHRAGDAFLNILTHAHELAGIGRIAFQKHFREADGSQWFGEGVDDVASITQDQLGAAAAYIGH